MQPGSCSRRINEAYPRPVYDVMGVGYSATRHEDPRIARPIWDALGDATAVANIGAGTGNYEPRDREVIAIEPSHVMRAQRRPGSARAIQGTAERIPLGDASVDAAMAVLSDQHWSDRAVGLAEMLRIARRRVVALTFDERPRTQFWLTRDYLTEYASLRSGRDPNLHELAVRGRAAIRVVPSLMTAPTASRSRSGGGRLRTSIRRCGPGSASSTFSIRRTFESAMERLADDLASGAWAERNRDLLELDELDLGLRLVVWEKARDPR